MKNDYQISIFATLYSTVNNEGLTLMLYAVNIERPLEGKVGGAIAVGAGEGGGSAITIGAIYNWMRSCGVIGVPGELNGVTAKAAAEGEILYQEKRLRQARVLGENVLRVATKLHS